MRSAVLFDYVDVLAVWTVPTRGVGPVEYEMKRDVYVFRFPTCAAVGNWIAVLVVEGFAVFKLLSPF